MAVAATFAPSFQKKKESSGIFVVDDEVPEPLPVNGSDFHFIFIIDRSGSMGGDNIIMARKALELFVQSMPAKCRFSIISFGSSYELHK